MKAIIIDDEPLARSIVKEYLSSHHDIVIAAECSNGFEGVKAISEHKPGLVFLDIQMPKINGFEMLELIEEPPAIIFTTAFDEYAIRAFEIHAVDYLLKPFSKERFDKAVQKVLKLTSPRIANGDTAALLTSASESPAQSNRIVVKDGSKIRIIPVAQLQYAEAADDYVKLVTPDGTFLKNKTLSHYENSLAQHQFIRIHRSYLVNSQLITRIDVYEKEGHIVTLKTGKTLPVSKTGYQKLKERLGI